MDEFYVNISKKIGEWCKEIDIATVGKIAKFLGIKFKPWGKIKLTDKLNKFGKIFGVVGPIIDSIFEYLDSKEAEKQMKALRDARRSIRNEFMQIGQQIEKHFKGMIEEFINESIIPQIDNIEEQLTSLKDVRDLNNVHLEDAFKLLNESKKLIQDIHSIRTM